MKYILGKKIGMTSILNENDNFVPVTVLVAGPCVVTQLKNQENDGYSAVQIGFDERKKQTKPLIGHLKKSAKLSRYLREYRIEDDKEIEGVKVGDIIDVSLFEKGNKVKVIGNIKAKGFAGGIKRWGFKSHPGSHGHGGSRKIGSIGGAYPQHVFKGKKMPGRKGPDRKTIANLEIVDVDKENGLLLVKGSVPGVKGRLVEIKG